MSAVVVTPTVVLTLAQVSLSTRALHVVQENGTMTLAERRARIRLEEQVRWVRINFFYLGYSGKAADIFEIQKNM